MAEESGDGGSLWGDVGWIIGVIVVLAVVWVSIGGPSAAVPPVFVRSPGPSGDGGQRGFFNFDSGQNASGGRVASRPTEVGTIPPNQRSPYFGQVSIYQGTASGAEIASDEYIILVADENNSAPLAISGWTLGNSRVNKSQLKNNELVPRAATRLLIPTGVAVFRPSKQQGLPGPIVLKPGETAYMITGEGDNRSPYLLNVSFKTNKCLGYVEDADNIKLIPSLHNQSSCPAPRDELADIYQAEDCQSFIDSLPRCQTPEAKNPRNDDPTINGQTGVLSFCSKPALERLTYQSCFNRHSLDADFAGDQWYVYLNQRWEMWDKDSDIITLYDQNGLIVAQESY